MHFRAGSSSAHDEGERAFLQRRLALFAKVAFLISLSADVFNSAFLGWNYSLSTGAILDRLVTVAFAGMWLVCARGTRSIRFLRILDAGGALAIALGIAIMGRYLVVKIAPSFVVGIEDADPTLATVLRPTDAFVSMMVMLGGTVMFALRAAVIPSPAKFTLFVSGLLGLPFVLVPAFVAPVNGSGLELRDGLGQSDALLTYAVWWAVVTVACVVTSQVIYGLRRDVRKARRLGQYTLGEKLGEGGMGAVYRASHALLRRPTAVKLLPPDKAGADSLARFEREVQLTATLTHPNTITIYDYGHTPDGVLYYAMELVVGPTLQEVVDQHGPQSAARVAHILADAAGALAEAHAAGLIHRDIKPANIMLCRQGGKADVVKVLDFGLVKELKQGGDASLTSVDTIKGTPHYMSPEAIRAPEQVGPASDIYALGAVGYFLLTGATVFDGDSVVEVCGHHLHSEPIPASTRATAALPPALDEFLLSCLAKEPGDRPACDVGLPERIRALAGVDAWTHDDASALWKEQVASAVVRQPSATQLGAQETVAIDLSNRAGS